MRKNILAILCAAFSLLLLGSCADAKPDSSLDTSGSESSIACSHTYDNDCDADCNECGDTRTPAAHNYNGVCDTDCNECGDKRTAEEHTYDNDCDADCNVCGAERTPSEHVYDNEYDGKCNVCGDEREVPEDPVNGGNWTGEVPLK